MTTTSISSLLENYAPELQKLVDGAVEAHQEAVKNSVPKVSVIRRVMNAVRYVLEGSFQTLCRFERVAGLWALVCFGSAIFLGYEFWTNPKEGPLAALAAVLVVAVTFIVAPSLLFGWVHLYPALRQAFGSHGQRAVMAAQANVFVASRVDPQSGNLKGFLVSPDKVTQHSQSYVTDVTTTDTPCAYLRISDMQGRAFLLLNASTDSAYVWHGSSVFLETRGAQYAQAMSTALRERGLLQQLQELAVVAGNAQEQAPAPQPSVFASKALPVNTGVASTWDALVVSDEFKEELQSVVAMMKNASSLRQQGFKPPTTLLLYGPPGTGKTQVARTLATESEMSFLPTSASDFKAEYIGASAPKVQAIFKRARSMSPCILFVDEIESVVSRRDAGAQDKDRMSDEIVAEFLVQLDGVVKQEGDVFLMAATNFPEKIDAAVMSRFKTRKEVPLPDLKARRRMLDVFLQGKPLSEDVAPVLDALSQKTEGLAGRDLLAVCERAEQRAIARALKADDISNVRINAQDFAE